VVCGVRCAVCLYPATDVREVHHAAPELLRLHTATSVPGWELVHGIHQRTSTLLHPRQQYVHPTLASRAAVCRDGRAAVIGVFVCAGNRTLLSWCSRSCVCTCVLSLLRWITALVLGGRCPWLSWELLSLLSPLWLCAENSTLPNFDQDLATFLLIRGPYAWLGYG
jgi:hypothetical protein